MRFYSRNLSNPIFKKEVDKDNWTACNNAIASYSDREKDILTYIYGSYDTLADNVYTMAKKYSINQAILWDMMKDFERKIAEERELL